MRRKIKAIIFCVLYIFVLFGIAAVTKIDLTRQVHGDLGTANGGTGASTAAARNIFSGPLVGAAAAPSFKSSYLLLPIIPILSGRKWAYSVMGVNQPVGPSSGFCGSSSHTQPATSSNPVYDFSQSGTTSGNTATFPNNCTALARFDANPFMNIKAGMSVTTNSRYWIGLSTSNVTNADDFTFDGLAFRYSTNAGDTHWQCVTNDNSATSHFVDSGISPDTNLHNFSVYYDSGGGTAYFWIDGNPVCNPVTTQVPRTNQTPLIFGSCTTLLTGQSCQARAAWIYEVADR